jgi:hypothetical protein
MIGDLDATLTAWLSELVPYASVSLTSPDGAAGTTKQSRAALALTLVDLQEEQSAGTHSWSSHRSDEGQVVGRVPPRRVYRFTYLITAFAKDTVAEHELLGNVLVGLASEEVVPEPHLRGVLSDCGRSLMVRLAPERPEAAHLERWGPWQLTRRTTLELCVTAPIPAGALEAVAPVPSQFHLAASGSYRPPPSEPAPQSGRRPTGRISET